MLRYSQRVVAMDKQQRSQPSWQEKFTSVPTVKSNTARDHLRFVVVLSYLQLTLMV